MKFNASLLDILNSTTKLIIAKFLLTHEALMSEREIASILKVSHMSINRTMRELSEVNFVNFVTVGKAHLWKVNRKSYTYKALSELIKGISNVRETVDDLRKVILNGLPKTLIKRVIIFGSVAKGMEKPHSDIDIFILTQDSGSKDKLEPSIEKLSNICLEKYGNRLAPYVLTEQEMKKKKKLKIISEIEKGVQIFPGGR